MRTHTITTYEFKERETVVCENCGEELEENNIYEIDGEYYCHDCFRELFAECDRCGAVCSRDTLQSVEIEPNSHRDWCEDCVERHAYHCDDCGNLIVEYIHVSNNDIICWECYEANYFTCDHCGNVFNADYYSGDGLCENCYHEDDDDGVDGQYIHNYHHRNCVSLNFHRADKEISNKRTLYAGIELEVEGDSGYAEELVDDYSDYERVFWLEHDGSLGSGFEMVYQPRTLNSWHEYGGKLEQTLQFLRGNKFKSHDTTTCGLHVHISRKPLNKADEVKLGLFCGMNQGVLNKFGRRNYNQYCNSKKIAEKKTCNHNESGTRYEAINYQNNNTIEFRFFRGSLRADTVLATVEFCFALVAFVKCNSMAVFNGPCWTEFVAFVENERKQYPKLQAYIDYRNTRTFPQQQNSI